MEHVEALGMLSKLWQRLIGVDAHLPIHCKHRARRHSAVLGAARHRSVMGRCLR